MLLMKNCSILMIHILNYDKITYSYKYQLTHTAYLEMMAMIFNLGVPMQCKLCFQNIENNFFIYLGKRGTG